MGKELRQVGKSGVMINKNWKRGENPAFDKVLEGILGGKEIKAELKKKGKTKSQVEKLLAKKLKNKKSKTA